MTAPPPQAPRRFLRAPPEDLCLDFVNTKFWRGTETPTEQLLAPSDLLAWCAAGTRWPPSWLAEVEARWAADPAGASADFAAAIALREGLWRVFAATTAGAAPESADLAALNAALAAAPRPSALSWREGDFVWTLPEDPADLLLPVVWSAAALLAGERRARVRQCANPQCRWLFLDGSKGGNRRWCAMSACGNRAKAHRHYAKRRQTGG
jgi:predicted RNA-binding Zn ribbon-like protein